MKHFIPGHTFRDNKYYVFNKHGVTVMRSWPHMTAYRKTKTKGWQALRPKFAFGERDIPNEMNQAVCHRCDLNDLYAQDVEHECQPHPLIRYLALVPPELLTLIKDVGTRQWHLLALFARCGEKAVELYQSTPALAWMLASSWAFKTQPVKNHFRSIRALLQPGKSQCDILRWLDFPSTKQTVKLLRKVDMSEVDVTFFLHLKQIITNQTSLNTLRHLPCIDYSVVRLLANHPLRFSFAFLHRFQQLERKQHRFIKDKIKDTVAGLEEGLAEDLDSAPSGTIDMKVLDLILAMLPSALDETTNVKPQNQQRVFPWPHFELPDGFPEIAYLDTEDELFAASEVMHNCLDSQADNAYLNAINFFQINYQEPVIFSVTETPVCNVWVVNEIKGVCNKAPSACALTIIKKWLCETNRINSDLCIELDL